MAWQRKDVTLQPLNDLLQEYGKQIQDVVFNSLETVAKETVKELKANSPKSTSGYAKGWTKTKRQQDWKHAYVLVYNNKKPWLTHLLNNGHAKRGGGRVMGDLHIDMASDYATERLEEIAIKELSKL